MYEMCPIIIECVLAIKSDIELLVVAHRTEALSWSYLPLFGDRLGATNQLCHIYGGSGGIFQVATVFVRRPCWCE